MAILKETKDAQASQRAAVALQQKLKDTLASKLPKADMGSNYGTAVSKISNLVDSSNYKGAREYVASQLTKIQDQKIGNKKAEAASQLIEARERAVKDNAFKNKPKLDKDRGPYYGT